MKYLITMLAVSIFSCATIAQTPRLKSDKVGKVFSPETWGKKEWKELGSSRKLWQGKKAPVSHNVPIVCGKEDGKCGVTECKCTCHKKAAAKGRPSPKGRPASKGKRGSRRSEHKGRSHRSSGKRGSSRRSHARSHARKGPPTKKAKDAKEVRSSRAKKWLDINTDERKKWGEAIKKRLQNSNKSQSDALRKRIQEFRKNNTIPKGKSISSHWLIAKES